MKTFAITAALADTAAELGVASNEEYLAQPRRVDRAEWLQIAALSIGNKTAANLMGEVVASLPH